MLSAASMVSAWGPKVSKTSAAAAMCASSLQVVAGVEMALVVISALGQGRGGGREGPED
jgi:hypothetical protein